MSEKAVNYALMRAHVMLLKLDSARNTKKANSKALEHADEAVKLASSLGRCDLNAKAQLYRGFALCRFQQWKQAYECFVRGTQHAGLPTDTELQKLRAKCAAAMEKLQQDGRVVEDWSVVGRPDVVWIRDTTGCLIDEIERPVLRRVRGKSVAGPRGNVPVPQYSVRCCTAMSRVVV